jgi:hypothetical protein
MVWQPVPTFREPRLTIKNNTLSDEDLSQCAQKENAR